MHHLTVSTDILRLLKLRPLDQYVGVRAQEHPLNRCPNLAANRLGPIATDSSKRGGQVLRSWFEVYAIAAGLDSVFALHHKLQAACDDKYTLAIVPCQFEGQQIYSFRFIVELYVDDDSRDYVCNLLRTAEDTVQEFAQQLGEQHGSL